MHVHAHIGTNTGNARTCGCTKYRVAAVGMYGVLFVDGLISLMIGSEESRCRVLTCACDRCFLVHTHTHKHTGSGTILFWVKKRYLATCLLMQIHT